MECLECGKKLPGNVRLCGSVYDRTSCRFKRVRRQQKKSAIYANSLVKGVKKLSDKTKTRDAREKEEWLRSQGYDVGGDDSWLNA